MTTMEDFFRNFERLDHACMRALPGRRTTFLTAALRLVTWTAHGSAWAVAVVVLAAGIRYDFIRFPHREEFLRAMIAPLISWFLVKGMKVYWHRRRPFQAIEGFERLSRAPLDDSFPSGHTASAFAFLVALCFIGGPIVPFVACWAILIAFSRYYLGVHFPTDILVGALVGCLAGAVFGGVASAYAIDPTPKPSPTVRVDKYASYTELAKHEREGIDYLVETRNRNARILVVAIHGEYIEPGSDDVAEAIAYRDLNKYIFRANAEDHYQDLHVTSAHFDDPRALHLAAGARLCVSVHGYRAPKESVCLGGGNAQAKARVESAIRKYFPEIEIDQDCAGLAGVDPMNIVNRCRERGVQIEMSKKIRDRLVAHPGAMVAFAKTIRNALAAWR